MQLLTEEVLELKTISGLKSTLEKTTLWPRLVVSNTLHFSVAICFGPHLDLKPVLRCQTTDLTNDSCPCI